MHASTKHMQRAFGLGADARLAGQPRSACPYRGQRGRRGAAAEELALHWWQGWDSVDREFGVEAKWPVKALPAVGV